MSVSCNRRHSLMLFSGTIQCPRAFRLMNDLNGSFATGREARGDKSLETKLRSCCYLGLGRAVLRTIKSGSTSY
jgi:hypothetical protein